MSLVLCMLNIGFVFLYFTLGTDFIISLFDFCCKVSKESAEIGGGDI